MVDDRAAAPPSKITAATAATFPLIVSAGERPVSRSASTDRSVMAKTFLVVKVVLAIDPIMQQLVHAGCRKRSTHQAASDHERKNRTPKVEPMRPFGLASFARSSQPHIDPLE
jgi:hypothetical protein